MQVFLGSRRIQNIGYSFLVSVPKVWIKHMKLSQGSKIDIEMQEDGSIKITPSKPEPASADNAGCTNTL